MKTIKGKLLALLLVIVSIFTLAACKPKTYTLSFETNREGVTLEPLTVKRENEINLGDSEYQLTSEGYVFKGWFFDAQLTRMALVFNLEEDTTVYAKWAKINTITFNTNGGSAVEALKVEEGNTCEKPDDPTKDGYAFAGWFTDEELTTQFNWIIEVNEDMELYAKWNEVFTVTFETNGGTEIAPVNIEIGKNFTLPQGPTKEGYKFSGWFTNEDLTEPYISTGTISANLTLYAKWTGNTYTVIFNSNGGKGNMAQQSFVYGIAQRLSANTFTKTGYVFNGWSLSETGEKVYDNEEEVSTLISSGSLTLYAVWEKVTLSLLYDTNYPEDVEEPESIASVQIKIGDIKALYKSLVEIEHYTFAKWTLDKENPTNENSFNALSEFELTEALITSYAHDGEIKLYALWTPKLYTVLFIGGEATTGQMASQSFTYNVSQALSLNAFEKEGYLFVGWKDQDDNVYTDGESIKVFKNLILIAQWHNQVYTVTFNPGTGIGEMAVQNIIVDEDTLKASGKLTANQFTKVGHLFIGWATEENGEKVYNDKADVELEGSITLYALWEKASYTVKFNANGGVGDEMSDLVGEFGTSASLTKNIYTRNHYEFGGWALTSTGAKVLDDEETVTLDIESIQLFNSDRVLVLYAVWTPSTYTLTYNANGGVGSIEPQVFIYGEEQAITLNTTITRTGYEFKGWSLTANGTVYLLDGAKYELSADTEIFAVWEQIVNRVVVITTNGYQAGNQANVLDEFSVYDAFNISLDGETVGQNINTVMLSKTYTYNDLTYIGLFKDYQATQAVMEDDTYHAQSETITLYAYFALTLKVDLEAFGEENVIVNVYKENGVKVSYDDLYEHLPELSPQSGKVVFYDNADLRNITKSLIVTAYVLNEDAENVTRKNNTFTVDLGENKVVYISKFYQGFIDTTYRSVNVLYNEDKDELFDATDPTHIDVIAKKVGYSVVEIEGSSGEIRLYQVYTRKLVSSLSVPSYEEYATKNLSASGSRWIDKVKEGYRVGSGNIFKLRLNSVDNNGDLVTDLSHIDLEYAARLGGPAGELLTIELVDNLEIDGKTYTKALKFFKESIVYLYVLTVDDEDKSFVAIKFTSDANDKEFNLTVSVQNSTESVTLDFSVNGGVNVENNAELKLYYADLDVTEINIHKTIIAELDSNQMRTKYGKTYPINYEPYNQLYNAQRGLPTGDVYVRAVKSADTIENHLKVNGNYFTIDGSNLPIIDDIDDNGNAYWSDEHNAVNKDTQWGVNGGGQGKKLWVKNVQTSIFANLLAYRDITEATYGYELVSNGENLTTITENDPTYNRGLGSYQLVYSQYTNSVSYNNLYIIGNTITPQVNYSQPEENILTDEQLAAYNSGGYNGIMNRGCTSNMDNVVIDYTNIGLNASCDNAVMNIKDTYVFYSWANSLYGWSSCVVNLENSEFRYSGGASIHIDEHRIELGAHEVYDYRDGYRKGQENERILLLHFDPVLNIDNRTKLVNWVSGSEAWFNIYGLNAVTTLLTGTNDLVNALTAGAQGEGMYSIVKSFNNLADDDVAYTQNKEGNTNEMFNFAVLMREGDNFENATYKPNTTGLFSAIQMNINGVDIYRKPVQVAQSTYLPFATASVAGGYASFYASQIEGKGDLVPYPVSPLSQFLDSQEEIPGMGGAKYGQVPPLLGIHAAFEGLDILQANGGNTSSVEYQTRIAQRSAIIQMLNNNTSVPLEYQTWDNWSAYKLGLQMNPVLNHDGTSTGYGMLECNLALPESFGNMRCILLTYYYQGREID